MRPIDLDFRADKPRFAWAGRILLAIAVALAADAALSYSRARDVVADREARLARLGGPQASARTSVPPRSVSAQEITFARDTVRRISTPWPNLFGALESNRSDDVSLLSIEPDPEAGTVLVSGEGKDYLAVLNYVSRLEGARTLRQVDLTRHEVKQDDPLRAVAFGISASWRDAR